MLHPNTGIEFGKEVDEVRKENAALREAVEEVEKMYPNWMGRFPSLAESIKCHTDNQDAVIARLRSNVYQVLPHEDTSGRTWRSAFADADSSLRCAEMILSDIESHFPNWKSYRNLDDCIRCELAELRRRAGTDAALKGGKV
jgi:hypothetical protein